MKGEECKDDSVASRPFSMPIDGNLQEEYLSCINVNKNVIKTSPLYILPFYFHSSFTYKNEFL